MARGRPATPLGTFGEIRAKQLDSGRWQAETRLRLYNGESVRLQARGKSKTAAINTLKEKCADRLGTSDTQALSTTSKVSALLEHWVGTKTDLRPQTLERYRTAMDKHIVPAFGEMRINEVSPAFLHDWINAQSSGVVGNIRSVLKGAFGLAVRYGLRATDPMAAVETRADEPKSARALTPSEIPAFRAQIAKSKNDTLIDVVDFVLATGLRAGEVLAVRFSDVDLDAAPPVLRLAGTLVHSKATGLIRQDDGKTVTASRVIQLPAVAVEILTRRHDEYGEHLEIVFPSGAGTYLWQQNFGRWLRDARGDRFDWVSVHTLRKTLASIVADELGPHKAADVLGHADSRLTERVYYERNRQGVPIGEVVDNVLKVSEKSPNKETD